MNGIKVEATLYSPFTSQKKVIDKLWFINMQMVYDLTQISSLTAYTYLFYKQPIYKQLALGCQIAKQLSGLNPLSLSNNKN